ncbi:hypothetical protein [Actinomyces glycerinitolerans]|nr:hypothetical protein [Actinomyces glycerinitolerans]
MRASDARADTGVWCRAWCDTYVRPEGATRQWVDEIWKPRLTDKDIFNRGAQRFYIRLGFKAVPGSDALWRGVLPVVTMRRPADWRQKRMTGAR